MTQAPASRHLLAAAVSGLLALAATPALADPVVLAPQYAGSYELGVGADAYFAQIDPNWKGSQVLWNEATQSYGTGSAIGGYDWGTGLWGRSDWERTMAAARGVGDANAPSIINEWDGLSGLINWGNACYNTSHSGTWGTATALPFDTGACGTEQNTGNWISHFSGFIRVADFGLYNFSVLFDDGFFFKLIGADGQSYEIGRDFLNARDRVGFDEDFQLSEGLYGFELGTWNRLQAGVVDLRWSRDGNPWELVPIGNLVPGSNPVSEPAVPALVGLAMLAALVSRRRPVASAAA